MLKEKNKQLNFDMIAKSPLINSNGNLGLKSVNIVSMLDTRDTKQESKTKIEIKRWRHKLNKIFGQASKLNKVSVSVAEWYIKKNQTVGNIWTIKRKKELEAIYKLIVWIVLTREEKLLREKSNKLTGEEWKLGVDKTTGSSFILMNDWQMLDLIEKHLTLELIKEFREMKQLGIGFNMSLKWMPLRGRVKGCPRGYFGETENRILQSYYWIPK